MLSRESGQSSSAERPLAADFEVLITWLRRNSSCPGCRFWCWAAFFVKLRQMLSGVSRQNGGTQYSRDKANWQLLIGARGLMWGNKPQRPEAPLRIFCAKQHLSRHQEGAIEQDFCGPSGLMRASVEGWPIFIFIFIKLFLASPEWACCRPCQVEYLGMYLRRVRRAPILVW